MVRMVVDGFGVALLPPAIISRELHEGSLQLLKVDIEMPTLPLIASFRTTPENPLYEQVALLAQDTAQAFARAATDEVARVPIGLRDAAAWEHARRAAPNPQR